VIERKVRGDDQMKSNGKIEFQHVILQELSVLQYVRRQFPAFHASQLEHRLGIVNANDEMSLCREYDCHATSSTSYFKYVLSR